MTKADIVAKLAEEIKITKAAAAKALSVVTGSIEDAIKKGEKLTLVGFGTFSVIQRKARKGKKPQDRQRDQDCRKEGAQVRPGSCTEGSCKRKSGYRKTQSEESLRQNRQQRRKRNKSSQGGPSGPRLS